MMQPQEELKYVWKDLADLIARLPAAEQARFQYAFRLFVHDLRHSISVIYGAETLLRRSITANPDDIELLDSIQVANQRSIKLVTDLAQPFDREITLPLQSPPKPDT